MATTTAGSKQSEELKRNLFSTDNAVVMRALLKCSEKGTAEMIEPLLALYATTTEETFKAEINRMLSQLKVTGVEDAFMNALVSQDKQHMIKDILTFMWNSGVQPVAHVAAITRIAIAGTYEVALEALTLIESMDDEIDEGELTESIAEVTIYLGENAQNDHTRLMQEYLRELQFKADNLE
ncbi:MAG: hypothetical protein ACKVOR_12850 [Flavobacteriales bacterium]